MRRTQIRRKRPGPPRRRAGACREYLDWLKEQPCQIMRVRTGDWLGHRSAVVDPAHVRTRRNNGDLFNAISLERSLHDEQNSWNCGIKTWQERHGVDLAALAKQQTEEFLQLYPEHRTTAAEILPC